MCVTEGDNQEVCSCGGISVQSNNTSSEIQAKVVQVCQQSRQKVHNRIIPFDFVTASGYSDYIMKFNILQVQVQSEENKNVPRSTRHWQS